MLPVSKLYILRMFDLESITNSDPNWWQKFIKEFDLPAIKEEIASPREFIKNDQELASQDSEFVCLIHNICQRHADHEA